MSRIYELLVLERTLRELDSATWKTKEGKKIKLHDMTDDHLERVIRMLDRKFAEEEICLENPDPNYDFSE